MRLGGRGQQARMTDPLEDTQLLSAEEVAEITGEAEEQDETGAPEKVAETEETQSLGGGEDASDGDAKEVRPELGLEEDGDFS